MVTNEELNDLQPLPYERFEGMYIDAMPALREAERIPMTTEALAKRRLEVLASGSEELIRAWWNNYYDTSDGVAYLGDEIKILKNSQLLIDITPEAELKDGALVLTEDQYNTLEGKTFKRSKLGVTNDWLTKEQAKKHPVWQELLGDVLEPYVDAVFEQYEKQYGKRNELMGVFLADAQDVPTLRSWFVGRLNGRSDLIGCNLDHDARLVGVLDKETN